MTAAIMKPRSWKQMGYFAPLLFLLLFVQKPFHIDDTLFIHIGNLLPWSLLGSTSGEVTFLGKIYQNLSPYESTHPPLIPYFTKILGIGSRDGIAPFWLYHLGFLIFPFLTLFEGRKLSQEKGISPLWVWFLVFSPLFFVNATNLMTDIAMVTFWLGSITSLVLFIEHGDRCSAVKTVFYLTAALFTSYQSVSLIPLMLVYMLVYGERKRKSLALIIIPTIVFLLFLLFVYRISGFFPFMASKIDYNITSEVASGMKIDFYLHKTIGVLVFCGLGLVALTPMLLSSLNRRRFLEYVVFASIVSFTFFYLGVSYNMFEGYAWLEKVVIRFFMLIGAIWVFFVLAKMIDGFRLLPRSRVRSAGRLLFSIWFFGMMAANILFMPYATARYFLPAIPPAIILLFNRPRFKVQPFYIGGLLVFLISISAFMAAVDYRQAYADWNLYRDLKNKLGGFQNLWFSDDSGLAVYLGRSGANYLAADVDELKAGDYVLITRGLISPKLQRTLQPIANMRYASFAGVSLFNTESHAGFYRSFDGFLPMAPASEVRRAVLYRVNSFLKDFDQIEKIQLSSPTYANISGFYLPNRQWVRGIHMHPDAEIAFPQVLSRDMVFSGAVALPPESWQKEGDGVFFQVGIREEGHVTWVWEKWVDAKNQDQDRRDHPFSLSIPAQTEAIHLKVGPGPNDDYRYDSVFWTQLELTEKAEN
ncbi:MAG: hypothetical protein CR997_01605 [Acidobacteria bacterium]|nr:MAG: hypothetical protein CR997_01605 [Acidobacteriota bacterium]